MWQNQWPGPMAPSPANPFPPNPSDAADSFTGYVRRGARAGMAAAIGAESVVFLFLLVMRGGFILLGSEESDGILDCLAIFFAGIFVAIGYGVGAICGAIAFSMRNR